LAKGIEEGQTAAFTSEDVDRYVAYILFLVYPRTSRVVLSMFNCHRIADGSSFLIIDFQIECTDAYEMTYFPLAAVFTVIYPLGVPLMLFYKLKSERLFEVGTEKPTELAKRKYGPMFVAYEPQFWYWEVIELYRKLFLCAVLQFIRPGSPSQILVAILTTVFYQSAVAFCAPYVSDMDDLLSMVAQMQIFCVALAGLLLKVNISQSEGFDPVVFDAMLTSLMVMPLFCVLGFLFWSFFLAKSYELWLLATKKRPDIKVGFGEFLRDKKISRKKSSQ